MSYKIQFRRGPKADLPILDNGEVGYTQDTEELFIGSPEGNKLLTFDTTKHAELETEIAKKANKGNQETPIQLTLLNGWAGKLYYFKDEFNIVHLYTEGSLSGGISSRNTTIAIVPTEDRPSLVSLIEYISIPVVLVNGSNTTAYPSVLRLSGDGELIFDVETTSGLYLRINSTYRGKA